MGSHVELHMLLGSMEKCKNISGFMMNIIDGKISPLLEPFSLYEYHEQIKEEMLRRGYNHNSEINKVTVQRVLKNYRQYELMKVNRSHSVEELMKRCPECRRRFENEMLYG